MNNIPEGHRTVLTLRGKDIAAPNTEFGFNVRFGEKVVFGDVVGLELTVIVYIDFCKA